MICAARIAPAILRGGYLLVPSPKVAFRLDTVGTGTHRVMLDPTMRPSDGRRRTTLGAPTSMPDAERGDQGVHAGDSLNADEVWEWLEIGLWTRGFVPWVPALEDGGRQNSNVTTA